MIFTRRGPGFRVDDIGEVGGRNRWNGVWLDDED